MPACFVVKERPIVCLLCISLILSSLGMQVSAEPKSTSLGDSSELDCFTVVSAGRRLLQV